MLQKENQQPLETAEDREDAPHAQTDSHARKCNAQRWEPRMSIPDDLARMQARKMAERMDLDDLRMARLLLAVSRTKSKALWGIIEQTVGLAPGPIPFDHGRPFDQKDPGDENKPTNKPMNQE